uniref:Methuselah N-terminal domain-containing protein n=1 Tax=Anopheles quadriannulatus TaxID=34691 RepID=A0A182WX85_ANOQN
MMVRCAMRTFVRLCCFVLLWLVVLLDGSGATIDNATGAVRDNSLPSEVPAAVFDQSSVAVPAATELSTATIATETSPATTTAATSSSSSVATGNEATQSVTATTATVPVSTVPSTQIEPIHQLQATSSSAGDGELPANCSEFSASPIQLMYSERARIRKCCPPGRMIEPRSNFQYECVPGSRELQIDTIDAQFYGNNECIEVSEIVPELPVVWNDLCEGDPQALMYSADQGDELFVLQNGSLLVLELGSLVSVFDSYCVEMTGDSQLLAKVCEQVRIDRVGVIEFFMLFSSLLAVLALLFTALSYSFVPKLKDSFGYLIAVHAGTFAIGTIFFGLARCAGRCIDPANVEVTEMFSNALLGTSVFVFFLMNVYNTMYVAYYIPNGLEYENKNKRDMYAFLAVLYCITLVPLFLFPRGGLICIVFLYFGAIVLAHFLSWHYARRLTSGIYLQISGQTKINQKRLNEINGQRHLCLIETGFALLLWIILAGLILSKSMSGHARIVAVCCIALQGLFIGVLFVAGQQRWIILRECWSNSGSVDLRAVENGVEMKTFVKPKVMVEESEDAAPT